MEGTGHANRKKRHRSLRHSQQMEQFETAPNCNTVNRADAVGPTELTDSCNRDAADTWAPRQLDEGSSPKRMRSDTMHHMRKYRSHQSNVFSETANANDHFYSDDSSFRNPTFPRIGGGGVEQKASPSASSSSSIGFKNNMDMSLTKPMCAPRPLARNILTGSNYSLSDGIYSRMKLVPPKAQQAQGPTQKQSQLPPLAPLVQGPTQKQPSMSPLVMQSQVQQTDVSPPANQFQVPSHKKSLVVCNSSYSMTGTPDNYFFVDLCYLSLMSIRSHARSSADADIGRTSAGRICISTGSSRI